MESFDYYDAKTPSSLASSPRDPEALSNDQTSTTLRRAAARLTSSTAPDSPRTPPAAYVLHDLWLAARHTRRDAEGLHGILQIVQSHIHDLQQELVSVAAEMVRQEQAHDIKMMEKQCEIRLLEAESTAFSMAAMARTATVASLQQYVFNFFSSLYSFRKYNTYNIQFSPLIFYRSTDALFAEREGNNKALATASADLQTATAALETKTAALQAAETAADSTSARNRELESLLEKLQLELDISKEKIEELETLQKDSTIQHETTKVLLEAAQVDASYASGQLVDACEENAKLSDAVGTLQVALEQRDVEVAQLRQENSELKAALQQKQQDLLDITHREGEKSPLKSNKSLNAARRVPVAVRTHTNPAFETPGSAHSTGSHGAIVAADEDDLLAIEVSRLRVHTEELEMQLAESKNAAPVLAALEKEAGMLRKENATLRIQVDHAKLESIEAQRELQQVQSEARVLHSQLSDVISSLAGAGLATSPIGLLQSLGASSEQPLLTLPPSSSRNDVVLPTAEKEREHTVEEVEVIVGRKAVPIAASPAMQATPSLVGLQSAASFSRGPPTPTWETPPPTTSGSGGGDGGAGGNRPDSSISSGGGGSDSILAELRSAMAHLDSVTAVEAGEVAGGETSHVTGEEGIKRITMPGQGTETTLPTATDILESISRGIAALGGSNDNEPPRS